MKRIYLDHSATTPLDERVFQKMEPFFSDFFGNPSSIHSFGMEAMEAVEKSRRQVADFLNATPEEIIFTSGATESDNLAVFGIAEQLEKDGYSLDGLHFLTTKLEHPAVEEPFLKLKRRGAEVDFLPVGKNGVVDPLDVKKAIKENTVFISVVYVNSEVGSRQPIGEIGKIVSGIKEDRVKGDNSFPLYFHTDAVQAANFFSCDVKELGVDLLSLSGHKVYGPKGVGALYVRNGIRIKGQQVGGHQENNLRSGTLNVPGIVGLGEALFIVAKERENNNLHLQKMQKKLIDGIKEKIPNAYLNTDLTNATPSHVHFAFPGAEGEAVLMELDMRGICVSVGSACASSSLKASPTLMAMGVPKEIIHGAVRMTLGKNNTDQEIEKILTVLPEVIEKYRAMAPKNINYGNFNE